MIIGKYNNIKISAIAAAVSNTWTSLDSMKTEDTGAMIDKFKKTTGVQGRYDAGVYQTTSDFCCAAAKKIMDEKSIATEEIGILVYVTQTADYSIPATACVLAERLGLIKDCIAFDVNLGCSGYVYGLNIVASLMGGSNASKALLLVGDTSAKEKSHKNKVKTSHSATMLFGDSGTATLLEKTEKEMPMLGAFRTDGAGYKAIISPYGGFRHPDGLAKTHMNDTDVFNFTIREVPELIREYFEYSNTTHEDYDCFVPHQANGYILKQLAKRAGIPYEKFLISLDEFGNTSSSSIPISLVKEYGGVQKGDVKPLMCGFGIGLSWGIVSASIDTADILPLIHTDEYFDDGYPDEYYDGADEL